MPRPDKLIFDHLSMEVSRQIVATIGAAVDTTRETEYIEKKDRMSFMTALLVQQADILHELIGFLLTTSAPKPKHCSPELKLLAALLVHYSAADVDHPYAAAIVTLDKLGHIVPEPLIKP